MCNVKRAVALLFTGKAEVVSKNERRVIHTISNQFSWPNVIRLNNFIKIPYKRIILSRKNILKRDGHKCAYCGRGDLPLTLDHIIPKSRGGDDSWENLVSACLKCNNKKGDRTPHEANMKLRIIPYAPNHIMFIMKTVNKLDESWKPFLFQY
ncbi:MAG: HNH endonuclease [Ignavibacteriales bacterium]|nr:HNH endonuclease [Ignavibacteriales bacterium]